MSLPSQLNVPINITLKTTSPKTTSSKIERHDIELVFFDIDGTLLSSHGQYSESLKQQIHQLHQSGIKTAIASGRPAYAAQFLIDELGINDIGVFCTGAEIYDPRNQYHLALNTLDHSLAYRIYQRAKACDFYCELYTPTFHTVDSISDISQIHAKHLQVEPRIIDGEKVFAEKLPIVKFLLGVDQKDPSRMVVDRGRDANNTNNLQQLESEFPEVEFAYAHFPARPTWQFASVVSAQANKKEAFNRVIQHYNISAEKVMAMGDSQSDILFMQLAGVGVAMGNAAKSTQAQANYVTYSNDDDGVAFALKTLINR